MALASDDVRKDLIDIRICENPGHSLSKMKTQLWCQACKRFVSEHKGNLLKHLSATVHKSNLSKFNHNSVKIRIPNPNKVCNKHSIL